MSFVDDVYKAIGANDENQDVSDWLSTGILQLNKAIGGSYDRGFPIGRIIEVYGAESCGKTLLATFAIKETQDKGGLGIFLDYEHAFSSSRAVALGMSVEPGKWIYKQPETAEEGFALIEKIVELARKNDTKRPITVVIDSVASMSTQSEVDAGFDESNMKTKLSLAAIMSPSLKKLASLVNKTNITLIFLNQVRDNPGVMYGDKESTPGGRALKFYASVRIKLRKSDKIKDSNDVIIGQKVIAQIVKNKCFDPFREAEYEGSFSEGVNLYTSLIDEAEEVGVLKKSGKYLTMPDGTNKYRSQIEKEMRADVTKYESLLDAVKGTTSKSLAAMGAAAPFKPAEE